MKHKHFYILCSLSVLFTSVVFSQQVPNSKKKSVDALFAQWNNPNAPGVAIGIVKDHKVIYQKCFGSSNLEYSIPIKPNTVFQLASVSKQFTAFAIAMLANKGMLSIYDDVHQYIPELPDYGSKISILNLLTHTSGLKDQWNLLYLSGWKTDDIIHQNDALNLILHQKELNFSPNTAFLYSNSGYSLLALIVERVTHQSFQDWVQENILSPLKMKNSFFIKDNNSIVKNKAYSYRNTEDGFEKLLYNSTTVGPNGLYATLEDLLLWVKNYEITKVGHKEIINTVNNIPILEKYNDTSLKLNYGYGQDISEYRGLPVISHDGSDAGYKTFIGRFPNQHFSVILLGNCESFDAESAFYQLADIFLAKEFHQPKNDNSNINSHRFLPEKIEKAIEGEYKINDSLTIRISVFDHNIMGENIATKRRFYFKPISNTAFENKNNNIKVRYVKDSLQQGEKLLFNIQGIETLVSRSEFVHSDFLKEYTGEYYSEAVSSLFKIMIINGQLYVVQPRGKQIKITLTDTDEFTGAFWWLQKVNFHRDTFGKIKSFEINSRRAKKILFVKNK